MDVGGSCISPSNYVVVVVVVKQGEYATMVSLAQE